MPTKTGLEKERLQKECEDKGLATSGSVKLLKERLAKYIEQESDLFRNEDNANQSRSFSLDANSFFIQAKLANISMYFINGYIYPLNFEHSEIYRDENRVHDFFTHYPNHIVISKTVLNDFDETQVLLEIFLKDNEIKKTNTFDSFAFYDGIIPISRIKKIFFASNSSKASFLSSCEIFPDAFVPATICDLIPEHVETKMLQGKPISNITDMNWNTTLIRFDRLMGLISFLKNTSLYYTNISDEYIEYTTNYFEVLSLINNYENESNKENTFFRWIINPETIEVDNKLARFQFKEILNAIYLNVEFDVDWALSLLEKSIDFEQNYDSKEQLQFIYKALLDYKKLKVDYRTILSNPLIKKNIPITILIFLIKFPKKNIGHSDKQAMKNFFLSPDCTIEKSTAEYIFAVMGLYYGYRNLVKEDSLKLIDPYFDSLLIGNAQVKFKLDSFLDRFTIESIFEFSRQGLQKFSEPFNFLRFDNRPEHVIKPQPRNNKVSYSDKSFHKHDKLIRKIDKISFNTLLAREIIDLYPANISQKNHIFIYVAKYFPELLTINSDKLAQLIKEHTGNANLQELEDTINLDKKYRSKYKN